MWTPQYDIIVETLTGSEFEVTVTDKDTIGYIKSRIQKYEGIPIGQQHLLYNQKELSDATEMKDIPLANGSRLKLVLDMKGGPVSARRVVNLPDYDNWFDLSDVLNTSRHDPLTITTPGVKLLVYKDCKKNVHRIMKLRSDRKTYGVNKSGESSNLLSDSQDDQWVKDNLQTLDKMHQLRMKLKQKKKGKDIKEKKETPPPVLAGQDESPLKNKIEQYSPLDNQPKNSQKKANVFQNEQCLKKNKTVNQNSAGKKPFPNDNLGSCEYFLQSKRTSGGILKKYGFNKTCIRPPSCVQQQVKTDNFFQLHSLSPLSLPPPYNSFSKLSEADLPSKFQPQSMLKNSGNNLVNYPKCKQFIETEEIKSKIRENIRRNRSFKAINDISVDDIIQRPLNTNGSLSSVIDQIFSTSCKQNIETETTSKSMQNLIEKMSTTQIGHKPEGLVNEISKNFLEIDQEKDLRLSKRSNHASTGFENKVFIDRQKTIGLNSIDGSGCAADFKLETTTSTTNSALDGSYRLYKMPTEAKNNYELPKLLIREDSPVESFHSSDLQLETLTIRGDSPKNPVDTYPKIATAGTDVEATTCESETKTGKPIIKSPWNSHHHSDLGLNNLELNFLNEEYSDIETDTSADNCIQNGSVLKIASNLEINSSWNNSSDLDGQSQPSTTSLNFINGDITSSDDEEDVFNGSCCMLHSNSKSKSIELNDFRMMFGSSPTLLNSNYNSVTHASRLDAVPIQYRRGYTNLNDACLSSSTSDLELFNGVRKKNSSKSASQELPSTFSRHRTNSSLDFIRSYENLDRTKIIRMKNERSRRNLNNNPTGESKHFWENNGHPKRSQNSLQNNFSRERLQEEELCDGDFSYSNLGYENVIGNSGNANESLPVDFPSDENLFNMNLDRFADEFNLLSSTTLSDRLSICSSNKNSNQNSLILSEVEGANIDCTINKPTGVGIGQNSQPYQDPRIVQPIPKRPEKQRCAECNKKLGLIMIMKCHCDKVFCPQHRYAEAHNCSYNFKLEGKKILAKENPLVVAQKIPKL